MWIRKQRMRRGACRAGRGTTMKKPQMILFDYGQTICTERWDDPLGGCRAVLEAAVENPRGVTPEQLDAAFWAMDTSLFRLSKDPWQTGPELCWHAFARSVFESLELKFSVGYQELEELFWYERTEPTVAVDYMPELLDFLKREAIRTGVVSNLCFNEKTLCKRINKCLPNHAFEFIMVSSEYAFRKPMPQFYRLALTKAHLEPGDVWFCGDNAVCDVDGPQAIGIQGIWFTGVMLNPESQRLRPQSRGHWEITDWRELQKMIEQG